MHYMSIVLELLEQRTALHEQLRLSGTLLPTLEAFAQDLREHHFELTEQMEKASPQSDPMQIASEALEIAVKELEDRLPAALPTDDGEVSLSLDQAMAYIRKPMPSK